MKLLEAIKVVTIDNLDLLNEILWCIESRKDTVEMQEPDPDKEWFWNMWEEKFDSICDIYDALEDIVNELEYNLDEDEELSTEEKESLSSDLNSVINDIYEHQLEFGGLKRLRV